MRMAPLGVLLIALLLAGSGADFAEGDASFLLAEVAHPGRIEALRLSIEGTEDLSSGRIEDGLLALEEALRKDPLFAPAWTNLSAGYIRLCRPEGALVAAMVGRVLDPESRVAADNLRIAMGLECESPPVETFVTPEEVRALRTQGDAALFVAAAASRRGKKEHLLAVFHEEWALRLGADRPAAIARIADDFEASGLLRAALAALESRAEAGDAERISALRARLVAIEDRGRSVARRLGEQARLASDAERRAASRYAEVLLAQSLDEVAALARLRELLGVGAPSTLREPWGSLTIGPEWALLRDDEPGAALATLRRFPGDTQVTLHPWSDPFDPETASTTLLRALAARSALFVEPWAECPAPVEGGHCSRAAVEIDTGLHGSARLGVRLFGARSGAPTLAALVLPGDAGCGEPCLAASRDAVEEVLATIEPSVTPGGVSVADQSRWKLPLPAAWRAPRAYSENEDPWRTHPIGTGLRVDLPPGIVVGRVSGAFADASCGRDTALWLRGSFVDADGVAVRVGSEKWTGWVDFLPGAAGTLESRRELAAQSPPRTDPGGRLVKVASLDAALSRGRRPLRGHVALFEGGEMPGRWLVYDIAIANDLVTLALPVTEGARSLSLHWIALTLRREESERLPAPVDLSEALDVDFQRFEGRDSSRDPREGLLRAAELTVAVPRGYRVSLSASSRDGFPVSFRDDQGGRIVFERLPAARGADLASRLAQIEALEGKPLGEGWQSDNLGRRAELAWAAFASADEGGGTRRIFIVAPKSPETPAFRVVMTRGEEVSDEDWEFQARIVKESLRVRRGKK